MVQEAKTHTEVSFPLGRDDACRLLEWHLDHTTTLAAMGISEAHLCHELRDRLEAWLR